MSTLSPERTSAAIKVVVAILILDVLGIGLIVPVLPELVTGLTGGDPAAAARWYGPLVAVYATFQFLCAPAVGALSDRYGRRPILLASVAALGVDYGIQAWAPTLAWLFLGRSLAGMAGASLTTVQATLADLSTPETRARNFGLVGASFGVGFILGPAMGGALSGISLRAPFMAAAVLSLLNLAVAARVLPETLPEDQRRPFRLSEAHPIASLRRLAAAGSVLPMVGALALAAFAQRGMESVWVLHATVRYGWDAMTNGLTLALVGVLVAGAQGGLIRKVVPRFGEPAVIRGGLFLWACAFSLYGLADWPWLLFAAMPLSAMGAMSLPTLQGRIAGQVEPSQQGAVQGGIASLMALVAAIAPLAATSALSWGSGEAIGLPGAPFFLGAASFLASLAVVHRVLKRQETRPRKQAG
jgi:DHA1 family tetracycline resistance protein-like MFS transporter